MARPRARMTAQNPSKHYSGRAGTRSDGELDRFSQGLECGCRASGQSSWRRAPLGARRTRSGLMKPLLNTTGACVVALALLSAATAFAQAPATFLLRSGERVRGDLIDTDAKGMLVTVNGRSQTWNVNDVAVIDFTGDATNFPRREVDL